LATDTRFEDLKRADKIWLQERRKRIEHIINGIYNEIRDGRILDVAMGKWSLVKTHFPKLFVVGIDRVSPSLLPDEFCLVDLKKGLPFKDGDFSMVFAGEILEHLGDVSAHNLLKEISRVLRSGGYLLLTTPNGFRNKFKHILKSPKIAAHEEEFSFSEIYKNLVQMGFKVIYSSGIQPLFIPWRVTTRFASLRLSGLLSSQLIFLSRKANKISL